METWRLPDYDDRLTEWGFNYHTNHKTEIIYAWRKDVLSQIQSINKDITLSEDQFEKLQEAYVFFKVQWNSISILDKDTRKYVDIKSFIDNYKQKLEDKETYQLTQANLYLIEKMKNDDALKNTLLVSPEDETWGEEPSTTDKENSTE